jgi:hypothetical protein
MVKGKDDHHQLVPLASLIAVSFCSFEHGRFWNIKGFYGIDNPKSAIQMRSIRSRPNKIERCSMFFGYLGLG